MGAHPREGGAKGLRFRPFGSRLWTYLRLRSTTCCKLIYPFEASLRCTSHRSGAIKGGDSARHPKSECSWLSSFERVGAQGRRCSARGCREVGDV